MVTIYSVAQVLACLMLLVVVGFASVEAARKIRQRLTCPRQPASNLGSYLSSPSRSADAPASSPQPAGARADRFILLVLLFTAGILALVGTEIAKTDEFYRTLILDTVLTPYENGEISSYVAEERLCSLMTSETRVDTFNAYPGPKERVPLASELIFDRSIRGTEFLLVTLLTHCGSPGLATQYLNSNNRILVDAAEEWAQRNGYQITTGSTTLPPKVWRK